MDVVLVRFHCLIFLGFYCEDIRVYNGDISPGTYVCTVCNVM